MLADSAGIRSKEYRRARRVTKETSEVNLESIRRSLSFSSPAVVRSRRWTSPCALESYLQGVLELPRTVGPQCLAEVVV